MGKKENLYNKNDEKEKSEVSAIYKKLNKNNSRSMHIGFIVIISLYIFFFLSPTIFHQPNEVLFTPLNEVEELEVGKSFSIESWNYSESQKLMEVQLSIENISMDGINSYDYYSAINFQDRNKKGQVLNVETKLQSYNYAVVWIKDVPEDFFNCSLFISMPDDKDTYISVYTNIDKVEKVDNIQSKTEEMYHVEKAERQIAELNRLIKKNNKGIARLQKENKRIEEYISYARANEIYQTPSEVEQTESEIESYNNEIASNIANITRMQEENKEYNADVLEYNKIIESIDQ